MQGKFNHQHMKCDTQKLDDATQCYRTIYSINVHKRKNDDQKTPAISHLLSLNKRGLKLSLNISISDYF
ncbi:hypothetical protein BpHYR1_021617 [Brachionus plicatilis]|uniref:Uncharacterized protein n=1 Tax=Brachionus plicatilis TaxID=10195 RepID=A0A3M7PLI3_BRAPC|nr:hypothetical protein BpHYR1_021617 [Brachionus plicatilis]